ncbi:hypothetical protein [Fluviicola taffensis]|uniref:DUF4468 domain-containing protein n=1 Tax=Fluviicola taffensis (strain DSM 16823 / NCIMB 13979 / RW262) TaxID=755732 RepID=F2IBJ8_FLUTR|nr:hypothetical protein [Fluviicola taffensis]AEA44306.1 hypothetical protein Fluta_2320 [Fluviicola taffensis DSM 16823]
MFKLILLLAYISALTTAHSQDLFPMKGDYIYYDFEEETHNTKHCLKYYSSQLDSANQYNQGASELMTAVRSKAQNLNELKVTLVGLKNTTVNFTASPSLAKMTSCIGEIKNPASLLLGLPTGAQLLEESLLFSLSSVGKFKVSGQYITATVKVVFKSDNKYSLVFTNFQITYIGTQGLKAVTEVLNLEEVYKSLKNGDSRSKMYNRGMKSMKEIDDLVKSCARIYSQELKRIYEIDDL